MGTVELLEAAVEWASRAGFEIREEWLGGVAGGACTIKGKKVLFLDIALPPAERLEQVLQALHQLPPDCKARLPQELRKAVETYMQQTAPAHDRFEAA